MRFIIVSLLICIAALTCYNIVESSSATNAVGQEGNAGTRNAALTTPAADGQTYLGKQGSGEEVKFFVVEVTGDDTAPSLKYFYFGQDGVSNGNSDLGNKNVAGNAGIAGKYKFKFVDSIAGAGIHPIILRGNQFTVTLGSRIWNLDIGGSINLEQTLALYKQEITTSLSMLPSDVNRRGIRSLTSNNIDDNAVFRIIGKAGDPVLRHADGWRRLNSLKTVV